MPKSRAIVTSPLFFVYNIFVDKITKEQRRRNMQAVKSCGSKIEMRLGRALWSRGLRYRKNNKKVFGKPDFTFKKYKVAIFCDGEFWHGKDWEIRKHDIGTNVSFWHKKIERSIERDKEVNCQLKKEGWTVFRFWGKEIEKELDLCVEKVVVAVNRQKETFFQSFDSFSGEESSRVAEENIPYGKVNKKK